MNRKIIFFITLLILIICTFLLVTGSDILVKPVVPGSGLPWGTIITWAGLIALPAAILSGIENIRHPGNIVFRILNIANKMAVFFALIWGFVSYYFANNWAFTFSQQTEFRGSIRASSFFWYYTFFIIVLSLTLLIVYFPYKILNKRRSK